MITFKHATAYALALGSDGNEHSPFDIEVIDLDTGEQPVDANGKLLMFTEVDTLKGKGIAYTDDESGEVFTTVQRRFQLRKRTA